MLEILFFLAALGGIGARAKQRGLGRTTWVAIAAAGWLLAFALSFTVLGPTGLFLRWVWLGVVYLLIQASHGRAKVSVGSWQCMDCRLFNDEGTLVCLCGYRHPDAPASVKVSAS